MQYLNYVKERLKMNIKEQFNFVAQEYDANRKKFIPCFDDYYENTTKFIVSNIEKPKGLDFKNTEKICH